MKKIVFTVTNDLTYDQRMHRICSSLARAGYTVQLIGRERSSSIPLTEKPYKQTRLNCLFNKGKLFYIEYNIRLFLYLLFTRFDAACAIDLDTIVPAYYAGKLKKARLVYDAHELFTEVPEVINRPRVKAVWEWVEKKYAPKFDLVYTVGPALAQLFGLRLNREVHVIRNLPIEADAVKLSSSSQQSSLPPPCIIYQGALNEGRGLEYLIEAMKGIDAKLLLAGEGDLSSQLRAQVKQAGLQDKVQFLGFVAPAELKTLTSRATIGVNLLENKGLSYHYSLANKFFDYIQAGVPQLCIDFPEYNFINKKYDVALLVENCSVNEIKTALQRLLTDKSFYSRLQKNCEQCRQHLNWEMEEVKLLALYEQLLR